MKSAKEWVENITKESNDIYNVVMNKRLGDASGMGEMIRKCIVMGKTARPMGLVLSGPAGTGKHTAAYHAIEALEQEGCVPVFLTGSGMAEDISSYADFVECLNAMLDSFYDDGKGLCLVIDEPEEAGFGVRFYSFLGRVANDYRIHPDDLPTLFIILISEKKLLIPSILSDMLLSLVFVLPDIDQRTVFVNERARSIKNYVSLPDLAKYSEGCSFSDLERVIKRLEVIIDTTDCAPEDDKIRMYFRQERKTSVEPVNGSIVTGSQDSLVDDSDVIFEYFNRLEEILSTIADNLAYDKIGMKISEISEKLSNGVFVNGDGKEHGSVLKNKHKDEEPEELDQKQIEDMPVRDLAIEIFGEEKAKQLWGESAQNEA